MAEIETTESTANRSDSVALLKGNAVKHVSNLSKLTKQFVESFADEDLESALKTQANRKVDGSSLATISNVSAEGLSLASLIVSQVPPKSLAEYAGPIFGDLSLRPRAYLRQLRRH